MAGVQEGAAAAIRDDQIMLVAFLGYRQVYLQVAAAMVEVVVVLLAVGAEEEVVVQGTVLFR